MEKKTLHVVPHSHWDREWYMSFEQHRMRLVELMDTVIELMEKDPDYTYYHMDGQFIVIEDYLEIRPEMRDRLTALIRANRIQIGPFYVLQDEYLTGGEANVRNLLYGIKLCRGMGAEPVMTGYFPDAFGNVGQIPQILQGFGIDNAAFGRGIGAILEDNKVDPNATSYPSEIVWRSPDGSEVIGILFSPWYNNAMELPADAEQLRERLGGLMRGLEGAGATPHYLALNGSDHQPVQTDLHAVLDTARELFPDWEIRQSNFGDYVASIRPFRNRFSHIDGEINGQRTPGQVPLVDTASAHVPLKQKNHRGQNALERTAEPLAVMAEREGKPYPYDQLFYSWRKLMQNHPHDSICTCSCDDVAREMDIRFEKSYQVASYIRDESMQYLCDRVDTSALGDRNIVVFHTDALRTSDCVTCYADYPQDCGFDTLTVYDEAGNVVPATVRKLGVVFTFRLPKDRFRQPMWVDRFEVTFPVEMEGIGYRTFRLEAGQTPCKPAVVPTANGAENEHIAFSVEKNGSLTVTDRRTGQVYHGCCVLEDVGDMGDLYNFRPADHDVPLTTGNDTASVRLAEADACHVTWEVTNHMDIPLRRTCGTRSGETVKTEIVTRYTLRAGVGRVDVETTWDNRSEDHRVRALFMPEIQASTVLAEGQFDVLAREIVPYHTWENPCYCQRMQAFFALEDERPDGRGLMVAVRGLNEYEILRDGHNTMALTLLRCVGQIGDWGYFPTPDGQCLGVHTMQYSVIPFDRTTRASAFREGFSFNGAPFAACCTEKHAGTIPASHTYFAVQGDMLSFAALKQSESGEGMILRLYNTDTQAHELTLTGVASDRHVTENRLDETPLRELPPEGGVRSLTVMPKKIVTLEIH